jgi:hypothetical protein
MLRVNAGKEDTLLLKVAHTLNYYPATRDSDITLSIKLLRTYYPNLVHSGDTIRLNDLYNIPKFYDMQRHRARLQNTYGLFRASPEVAAFRMKRELDQAESYAQAAPDFSPVFAFADESGKTDRCLIIGSLWLYNVDHHRQAYRSLADWRRSFGHRGEFHFKHLKSMSDADAACQFFDALLASTPLHAFKGLVARNDLIPANRRLDDLYQGFGEMLIDGIKSEITSGRLSPPLTLHLTKDADPATDVFKMRELTRKLLDAFRVEFADAQVKLDSDKIDSASSEANDLVQISDLFTGALNKWLNQRIVDQTSKPKDKVAAHIGSHFSWHFDGNGKLVCGGDVCQIIYLTGP